jgi:hypothetical protein
MKMGGDCDVTESQPDETEYPNRGLWRTFRVKLEVTRSSETLATTQFNVVKMSNLALK